MVNNLEQNRNIKILKILHLFQLCFMKKQKIVLIDILADSPIAI